jgi:SHS family lactate transporter-like MFS transporter
LLIVYIYFCVPESQHFDRAHARANPTFSVLAKHWKIAIYAILLMTAYTFFSHGTQDLYPTFLQVQHGFGPHEVGLIAVIYNVGAIIGGISFGSLSERFGRRRIIIIAAVLSLVVLPLWAFAASAVWLAIGAFLMQVMVQDAWGVIPVHLNELSPDDSRGVPGFVYQLGNLIASFNATLQAGIAAHYGGNYALALAVVAGAVAVAIIILTAFGIEAKGVAFGTGRIRGPADPRTAASSDAI